jgi:high-affinity iron transporter
LKLNLGRFFRVTGVFLVLIAAGLVLSALRTAHEAGWVTIGQQQVFSLSSWIPARSVRGALVTGLFGIPTDPRLIEVLGWLLYAVPVLAIFLWPARLSADPRTRRRLLAAASAALLSVAATLAIVVPAGGSALGAKPRTVTDQLGRPLQVSLVSGPQGRSLLVSPDRGSTDSVALTAAGDDSFDGVPARVWQATVTPLNAGDGAPTVTLTELLNLTGGRLPVGVSVSRTPGPFQARWAASTIYTVRAHDDSVLSAHASSNRTAVLSGGGLSVPKTVSVGGLPTDWSTVGVDDQSVAAQVRANDRERAEQQLWKAWLPLVLAAFALACVVAAARGARATGRAESEQERKDETHGESHHPGKASVA